MKLYRSFIKSLLLTVICLTMCMIVSASISHAAPKHTHFFKPIKTVKTPTGLQAHRVHLGQMLFHEARLSKNHDISCNSCHTLTNYGVDGKPTSSGHKGQLGGRNSPTVMNAFGHIAQFWDGRAKDVEEQAKGPVLNPIEMAMSSSAKVVDTLKSMPEYVAAFAKAFPKAKDPITYDHFAQAVGAFERQLSTPSRFDKYLEGKEDALSAAEKIGYDLFVNTGCTTCHSGALLGGHMYQKVGLVKAWPNQKDQGRFEVSKQDADKMMFKVPSLRNIVHTAPYFHDGQTADLKVAVKMMAEYQLGRILSKSEVQSIITFLGALSAKPKAEYLKVPTLPKSTTKTPKPNPN